MTWDVKVKKWHGVASWTWDAGDDVCGICRMPFDGCPPDGEQPYITMQRLLS
jgi:anaphase-promoting complex subunit 11